MRSWILGVLSLCIGIPLQAQVTEKLRRFLEGDTLAPPDHDTAYITTYRSDLTVSLLATYSSVDVDLDRPQGIPLSFTTNSKELYGLGINYKWLSAEATFNIPALSEYDASYGNTSSRGFGLGYTGRRLWARGFWNTVEGFYLNDPDQWVPGYQAEDPPYVRGDLSSTTYMLSVNYALSGKRRYSQNAALFQMERQKRSAGTFVAGFSGWVSDVHADSSIVTTAQMDTFAIATGFHRVRRSLAGATIGYTHTFAFWHKGFLQVALLPGVAYLHQRITPSSGPDLEGRGVASVTEMKAGLGYNGDRWYLSMTTAFYYCTSDIGEALSLGTNYGFVRLAAGLRFGAPNIKALKKVGL